MTFLSPRAKKAIKTGLAMVIAYGVALRMGWGTPHWAAMSVGMISMVTVGQSLNKALLRMVGTLVSAVLAFIYLSWAIQDRWLLLILLTVHLGICAYMIPGRKWSYGWFVCGYVCLIICADGHGSSAHAFHIAVTRAGETAWGILIYSLVSIFLWPQKSQAGMEQAAAKLFSTQMTLYQSCQSVLADTEKTVTVSSLVTQEAQLLSQFELVLEAAVTDSYEVWEERLQWKCFLDSSHDLMETMERLQASFPELKNLDLQQYLPHLHDFCSELDTRFAEIAHMLEGVAPERERRAILLELDKEALRTLTPFEKAAIAVSKNELANLELLSRSLFDTVAEIRGFAARPIQPNLQKQPVSWLSIDPERIVVALRVVVTLWIAFILWIFVNPPGGPAFVQISVTIALIAAKMPMTPPRALFIPYTTGGLTAGVLYLMVFPHLSSYWQLAPLIFSYFFIANYLFWKPQQGLALVGATIAFVNFTFIENEMVYDFSNWANSMIVLSSGILITIACTYIPASPRPEKIFLRLTQRFFRHGEFLLSRIEPHVRKKSTLTEQLKTALYSNDLAELPVKLAAWGAKIDHTVFPDNRPEQVQALVTALHELALRIKAVVDAREYPQASYLVHGIHDDAKTWRILIEKEFALWAENPQAAVLTAADMPDRLKKHLDILEARSREIFALEGKANLKHDDCENFYRLLGSYRGLSESGIKCIDIAREINWDHWRSARF